MFESPARWQYHPRSVSLPIAARVKYAAGSLLVAGEGERWWQSADQSQLKVADEIAPEPLVGAFDAGKEGWLFVGEGGTTYVAEEPLGRFLRAASPPQRLVRVAVSRRGLLGVTQAGGLWRSSNRGASWEPIAVPGRVADVALTASGTGLLLLVPEQLLIVQDVGSQIIDSGVEAFGALALITEGSRIRARAILQDRWYDPETKQWSDAGTVPTDDAASGAIPLREDAEALATGRALRTAQHYYELVSRGDRTSLLTGEINGNLSSVDLEVSGACPNARLGGDDVALYLVCGGGGAGRMEMLRFFRSVDGGRRFQDQGFTTRGDVARLQIATFGGGELVVSGVCPVAASGPGCRADGVHLRVPLPLESGDVKPRFVLRPLSVEGLNGLPLGIAQGVRAQSLTVVGARNKGDELTIFTSLDGGRSFSTDIVASLATDPSESRIGGASLVIEQMRRSSDGYVGLVVYDRVASERTLITLDDRGKVVTVSRPPSEAAKMASSGLAALAIDVARGDAWESADGGASWTEIGRVPVGLCTADDSGERCDAALYCHEQGCAIGSDVSRVGWKGQLVSELSPLPPRPPAAATSSGVRTPISCVFEDDSDWGKLAGGRAPDASRASLPEADWFTYFDDFRDGSVRSYEAALGKVRSEVLFAPDAHPSTSVLYASQQVEGVAALRFQRGQRVEVAWRNLIESSRTAHGHLPDSVTIESSPTRFNARVATPDLVSVASGGLYVRALRGETRNPSYFVTVDGRVEEIEPFSWAPRAGVGRNELFRLNGQNVGVWFLGNGAGLVRASKVADKWTVQAAAPGLLEPKAFGARQRQDLVYTGRDPGLLVMLTDTQPSNAWVFPFQASGAALGKAVRSATQVMLGAEPLACSPPQRVQTPRVIAPRERGSQHPVIVTHNAEPIRTLLTDEAVLYGTDTEPCVDVFDAAAVERSSTEELSALVHVDAATQSWLFRRLTGAVELEYRPMRCHLDPSAEIPPEVYSGLNKAR